MRGFMGILWRIYIVKLSLRWVMKVNLGDLVWYKDKKHVVYNGVIQNHWRLAKLEENGGWVSRDECKKVHTISNYVGSFKSGYRFYMSNWFDIWVVQGIKPWMRQCDIWGTK